MTMFERDVKFQNLPAQNSNGSTELLFKVVRNFYGKFIGKLSSHSFRFENNKSDRKAVTVQP